MPSQDAIPWGPAGLLPVQSRDVRVSGISLAAPPSLALRNSEALGIRRLLHGYCLLKPARFAHRITRVGWEVASAAILDRLRPLPTGVLREEAGQASVRGGALCLYAWPPQHWQA
jgi:hypothetical protein